MRIILSGICFLLCCFTHTAHAQSLSKRNAQVFADKYLHQVSAQYKKDNEAEWRNKEIHYAAYSMKFDYRIFGEKPFGQRSLYISLHGGGNMPDSVNNQQWENQKKLYHPKEGIYLAPRAPTNTWNLWHECDVDTMLIKIIHSAVLFEGVNPNKIYLMGYSAGGDGCFQLAPRMASYFAAASMMAGHPGDAAGLSLRNLPFSIYMGGKDDAYNRNALAAVWGHYLDSLHQADAQGYIHDVHIYADKGHWMDHKDTVGVSWMAQFTREPLPDRVVWVQDDCIHEHFYWLGSLKDSTTAGDQASVEYDRSDNSIRINKNTFRFLQIFLNDAMLNLNKPVLVYFGAEKIFSGNVRRSTKVIKESIDKRLDANLIFTGTLIVSGKKVSVF